MSNLLNLKLFLVTLYYLKISQILWRIYYYLKPRKFTKFNTIKKINNLKIKTKFLPKPNSIISKNKFVFLNKVKSIPDNLEIEKIKYSKLWIYNLNYFDFLNCNMDKIRHSIALDFMKRWVNEVKSPNYYGYDPYPTSIRIVNWIKFYLHTNIMNDNVKLSLRKQTDYLYHNLEWHLLGNHILANAKALIFSGLFFVDQDSKKWRLKGVQIYRKQLKEQILQDGGHFEKSPMYHAIILEDILDIINLSYKCNNMLPLNFRNQLNLTAKKMLSWLNIMSYKNGETPNFNDNSSNISNNIITLSKYAKKLGINASNNYKSSNNISIKKLQSSGFIRVDQKDATSFLDVGSIGASYIPGHAHADSLSFEASFFKKRFFVNLGVSTYENSYRRFLERSTKSHNTVEVDKKNSTEVWSSFRVAFRARVFGLKTKKSESTYYISCYHDGYSTITKKNYHYRNWIFNENKIFIKDEVVSKNCSAIANFILHPDIKLIKNDLKKKYILKNKSDKVYLLIKHGEPKIVEKFYAPEFGILKKTKCISISLQKSKSEIILTW